METVLVLPAWPKTLLCPCCRFLTSVTYTLPFTLMAAWVLFIAAFVKKLVQEKDLRLYEVV